MAAVLIGSAVPIMSGIAVASARTAASPSSRSYRVPASIAANCSVDVTAALNSWIATVANGRTGAPSVLTFAQNGCYAIGASADLSVISRNNLSFLGNGSTFRVSPKVNGPSWYFGNDTNIDVENLHVVGTNTASGISAADPPYLASITYQPDQFGSSCNDGTTAAPANCFESGLEFDHVNGVSVDNVTTDATWGDGITLGGEHNYADLTSNVVIDNVTIDRNGRQGIEVGTVNGVLIENAHILHSWASGIDLEVNAADGSITNVEIKNSYMNTRNVAVTPDGIAGVVGLNIHNNVVKFHNPSNSWVIGNPATAGQNWRIDNNVIDIAMDEVPALTISNVNGIEVSGNTSPEGTPPAARQGETLPAVGLQRDSGTISITGNNFTGDTTVYQADAATMAAGTITTCGNTMSLTLAPAPC